MRHHAHKLKRELTELMQYSHLLRNLIVRDLTVRYKRSVLGVFWTMLNPIIMTAVFTIVFSTVFRFELDNFIVYFLSGYLAWNLFAQTSWSSTQCILSNANLLRKIYVPKKIFVVSSMVSGLINFAFAMIPLVALMLLIGKRFDLSILALPLTVLFIIFFTLGLSFILSSLAVFFNDIVNMYQVLLIPWMYLTPIIYPLEIIPPRFLPLIKLNPMYYLVDCFRSPLYQGKFPDTEHLLAAAIIALTTLVAGYICFSRFEDEFVYYV